MKIGSIVFREQGGLVAGMHAGFHLSIWKQDRSRTSSIPTPIIPAHD